MKTSSSKLSRWAVSKFLLLVMVALCAVPASAQPSSGGGFAPAPGPNGFGTTGQFVVSVPFARFGQNNGPALDISKVSGGETSITIQPAIDYVIVPNLTVGGILGLTTMSGRGAVTTLTLGARGGYNFNLGDRLSLWPTAGLLFKHTSQSDGGPSNGHTYFDLLAPLLFHPAPHFFLGGGIFLNVALSDGDANEFGLESLIGGWF